MAQKGTLAGRAALVTGGSRGIGKGIALALAKAGADVAIVYKQAEEAAQKTIAELQALGRKAAAYKADVTSFEQVKEAVDRSARELGKLDILVSNAGVGSSWNLVIDTELEEVHRLMATHFFGAFYLTKAGLPYLRQQKRGDVFYISSVATKAFMARHMPYTAAKTAMEALARILSKEESEHGIRVNVIAPGFIDTDLTRWLAKMRTGSEDPAGLRESWPFGRVGQVADIGNLVAFLASDRGEYISGQVIYVNGGIEEE
jgi:NAD(P)-dependent dehydrogenase (short-subunit alcohol dehydrogenase family)